MANLNVSFATSLVFLYFVFDIVFFSQITAKQTAMTAFTALSSPNYWSYATMAKNYGGAVIFGVAFVT